MFSLMKSTTCSFKTTIYEFCARKEIFYLLLLLFMMELQFYQLVWAIQLTNVKTYGPNHLSNNLLFEQIGTISNLVLIFTGYCYCSSEHPECQQELMKETKQCIPSTQHTTFFFSFFFFFFKFAKMYVVIRNTLLETKYAGRMGYAMKKSPPRHQLLQISSMFISRLVQPTCS